VLISFKTHRFGVPVAMATGRLIALGSLLDSDLQGDFSIENTLEELQRAMTTASSVEVTGNSHTIVASASVADVVCNDDSSIPPCRIATRDLISLIRCWHSFRNVGTPDHWDDGGAADRGDAVHPLE